MKYLNRIICLLVLCICELGVCFLDIDEFRKLKYGIEIKRKPVILSHELHEDTVVHLSSKYGQMYQCNLPVREKENANSGDDLAHQPNITVTSILDDVFTDQCLLYNLGWWTYKVCYKKEVTQYHEDNGIVQGNIISLGSFESEKEWNDTDYKRKPNREEYHSHLYINGSDCELVGKSRQATLKFVCNDESSNAIMSVDEPETCTYSITIGCKELCLHPLFKSKKQEVVKEITCSPAISKDEYEKYLQQEQEHLLRKKKAEEDKLAKQSKTMKAESLMSSFDSFASGLTSFLTEQLVSAGDGPKENKQEQSTNDLSNFWKDLGFNPGDSYDSGAPTSKEKVHKQVPEETSGVAEEEPKTELEADNAMSKGDSMLSTEGQFVKKENRNAEKDMSKIKENEKRLISLKDRVYEIEKQAAALIRRDKEKMRMFMKDFSKSKRKVEKQIGEFKKLMSDLTLRKSKENDKYSKERLEKLIKRINGNIKNYKAKLSLLDAKVRKTVEKSKAFEKTYKALLQSFPINYASMKTDVSGKKKIKSLNEVIRELQTEKEREDASRIVKSGNQLAFDEESSKKIQNPPNEKQHENLNPLLETLKKVLEHAKKKQLKSDDSEESNEKENSKSYVNENTADTSEVDDESLAPSKPSQEGLREEKEDEFNGKIKVRISRLGSADTKLLEENEKQEELAGTNDKNNRLKKAGKKIEDIIKKKLKKAGVDIGANIKIKIITNEGPLSSLPSNGKTEFLTDETATQFKDLLTNMLGGGAEKIKEEKRQSELEDSYKFVWNQDDEKTYNERTDSEDNDREPFFMNDDP